MTDQSREITQSHQLRRFAAVNRMREIVCGMQAKEAGYPLDTEWSQKDHAALFSKYMATK